MDFLVLEEVDSTNSYVSRHAGSLADMTMVMAATQNAGRGQRGNSWESEPGANLTFTLLHRPADFPALEQFAMSEAVCLAVTDWTATLGIEAKVKWPNDIYVGDRKLAGILIEHSVAGRLIEHSRIGVGLNVNQSEFRSDAPNPVSLIQLLGTKTDISRAAAALGAHLESRLQEAATPEGRRMLHSAFLQRMWRKDGEPHPFRIPGGDIFEGVIEDVDQSGPIRIRRTGGDEVRRYAFKEIEFVLK